MKEENLESITSERNYLWSISEKFYNALTFDGQIDSKVFRQSTAMAGQLFKGKMDIGMTTSWFDAVGDFLESFEKMKVEREGK